MSPFPFISEKGNHLEFQATLATTVTPGAGTVSGMKPDETVQLGELGPQAGNRVRVASALIVCDSHKDQAAHLLHICGEA